MVSTCTLHVALNFLVGSCSCWRAIRVKMSSYIGHGASPFFIHYRGEHVWKHLIQNKSRQWKKKNDKRQRKGNRGRRKHQRRKEELHTIKTALTFKHSVSFPLSSVLLNSICSTNSEQNLAMSRLQAWYRSGLRRTSVVCSTIRRTTTWRHIGSKLSSLFFFWKKR